uniref:Uncharacterized protein n=1 Tax=Magnetococcus massalia (strain MO-1) TaxID=451514 RepID=A0A1S7LF50_MAGMO|nr:protein of unknown function [Candidatus Magnetococcus massalia]
MARGWMQPHIHSLTASEEQRICAVNSQDCKTKANSYIIEIICFMQHSRVRGGKSCPLYQAVLFPFPAIVIRAC